jgi:Flp pilus assembly protein TadG
MQRIRVRNIRSQSVRSGAILVLFGMLLVVLIGLVGLVIDGGLLMASHRTAQNAADAAAMAAAFEKYRGRSDSDALIAANEFIDRNGWSSAPRLALGSSFNCPPSTGPYAGDDRYV